MNSLTPSLCATVCGIHVVIVRVFPGTFTRIHPTSSCTDAAYVDYANEH